MKALTVQIDNKTYTEDSNKIGMSFKGGVINYKVMLIKGIHCILLITDNEHLFIRSKNMKHLPSKDFIRAVKSECFDCRFTLLNNRGYSVN